MILNDRMLLSYERKRIDNTCIIQSGVFQNFNISIRTIHVNTFSASQYANTYTRLKKCCGIVILQ